MSTPGPPKLPTPKSGSSRLWIWLSLGFVVLALMAWGFGLLVAHFGRSLGGPFGTSSGAGVVATPAPLLQARIDVPFAVTAGERFEVRIILRNASSQDIELESIDFSGSLHNGFLLEGAPTGWASTSAGDPVEYFFNETLPPGNTVEKVFDVTAGKEGIYSGDLDIWNNGDVNSFKTTLEVTPVVAAPESSPAPGPVSGSP